MNKCVLPILAAIAFLFHSANAQTTRLKKPDSSQIREMIREHNKDMKKEKGLHNSSTPIPINSLGQKKTTAASQRVTTNSSQLIEAEVSIAYNPNDSNKIVLSYIEESTSMICPVYYSSNGGQTWSRSSFNTASALIGDYPGGFLEGGGDPVFAWDKNGKLYMAWIYSVINNSQDTSYFNLYWAYSTDNGKNWTMENGANHFIGRGASDLSTGDLFPVYDGVTDREWLAVDNSGGSNQGDLYCSFLWESSSGSTSQFGTGVRVKKASANNFGPITLVYNGQTQFANVEVGNNGTVHISLSDLLNDVVLYASSTNGGASFSNPVVVGTGVNMFGQQGFMHDRENSATNLGIADDGSLHLVWGEFGNAATAYYSRSTDGGNTWSPQLDLGTKYGYASTEMPTIAAGKGISISFYATGTNDSTSYYQVNSDDYGVNFGPLVKMSSASTYFPGYASVQTFFGDYNRSVRVGCIDYSTWCDGRNSTGPKIYFVKRSYCDLGVKEVTAVTSDTKLMSVYPNPASKEINLDIETVKQQQISVAITDITGKQLSERTFTLNSGKTSVQVPLDGIASGSAFISVSSKDGLIAMRQIIIK
jgi:hypothetical protein